MRQVIICPGENTALGGGMLQPPRLHQPGQEQEEAIEKIKEAIEVYTAALVEDGIPVPEDRLDAILVAV